MTRKSTKVHVQFEITKNYAKKTNNFVIVDKVNIRTVKERKTTRRIEMNSLEKRVRIILI